MSRRHAGRNARAALGLVAALIGSLTAGCLGEVVEPRGGPWLEDRPSPGPATPDQELTLDHLPAAAPGPMMLLNTDPLPSLAAPGSWLELWVSDVGLTSYLQTRPETSGSRIRLPVGTAVVRTLRDANGVIVKHTALVQREPGFNPPSDLWFGVFDLNGQVQHEPDGSPMAGAIKSCTTCHLTRAEDGYVFGAPAPPAM